MRPWILKTTPIESLRYTPQKFDSSTPQKDEETHLHAYLNRNNKTETNRTAKRIRSMNEDPSPLSSKMYTVAKFRVNVKLAFIINISITLRLFLCLSKRI